jgi:hypothetical protein
MADEWIENLAQDIKQSNREAAQDYGRAQHYAGIVSTQGKEFFVAVVSCLRENVDALRRRLQGDPTSADTRLETVKPDEVKIVRAGFPWVDAQLTHRDDTIALDYAKAIGAASVTAPDRKTRIFAFRVRPDDTIFVEDAFVEPPEQYRQPTDLARHITEILFSAGGTNGAR